MDYTLKHIANRTLTKIPGKEVISKFLKKQSLESYFWKQELNNYLKWYKGEISDLYGCKNPLEEQKVREFTEVFSAVATWVKLFQETKYSQDLQIPAGSFKGLKVLDIGSGPFPSAKVFEAEKLYCLDPLFYKYIEIGYPIHIYENSYFVNSYSENIPFPDGFFDAVLSVNSLDHVDNVESTAKEMLRVLKPHGKLAIHAHFHDSTFTEPLKLTHELMLKMFGQVNNFKLISESKMKHGWEITEPNEKYCLYKNF